LGGEEDGVHHHDRTDGDAGLQSRQAHDPPAGGGESGETGRYPGGGHACVLAQRGLWSLAIPEAPSRDTDGHDDGDDHLGKENKEEDKEIEGAVTPAGER